VVEPRSLRQYSTVDKRLLHDIQLPQYVTELYHGVETASGTFVVSHQGSTMDEKQHAVRLFLVIFSSSSSFSFSSMLFFFPCCLYGYGDNDDVNNDDNDDDNDNGNDNDDD